jgi:hypothetical protein
MRRKSAMPAGSLTVGPLIQKQKLGRAEQGQRDAESLAHAHRVFSHALPGAFREPCLCQHPFYRGPRATQQSTGNFEVLQAAQVRI